MFRRESGYNSQLYIKSLSEFGTPAGLPSAGGYYIARRIQGSTLYDGMGAYPILSCRQWENLAKDLETIEKSLVSFCAVIDPLSECDETILKKAFPDVVLPFKQHHLVNFSRPLTVCSHHRRNARKAHTQVAIDIADVAGAWMGEWLQLYSCLVQKYRIGDLRAFSPCVFERQFQMPDVRVFRAVHHGTTVGMVLWIEQDDSVYYHLGAYSPEGYRCNASFALFDAAIEYFRSRQFRILNLGAGAGMVCAAEDGLTRFKRGWANDQRTAYFCGRILDREAYADLRRNTGQISTSYFPAYRAGEFCKQQSKPGEAQKP